MFLQTISIVAFAASIIGCTNAYYIEERIVGGANATIEKYAYQAALLLNGQHVCGGTIISKDWILTSANCTNGRTNTSLSVRVGSVRHSTGGTVVQVKRIVQHTSYKPATNDYDFSLLELAKSLTLSTTVKNATLPVQDESIPNAVRVSVSGWGKLKENGTKSDVLQVVEVSVVSQAECKVIHKDLTDRMVCAGASAGGKDACTGDEGGPMVQGNKLLGIISWNVGCARPNKYGVYSRVANQRNWIQRTTGF